MGDSYPTTIVPYRTEQDFEVRTQLRALVMVDDDTSADDGAVEIRMIDPTSAFRTGEQVESLLSVYRQRTLRGIIQKAAFPNSKALIPLFPTYINTQHVHKPRRLRAKRNTQVGPVLSGCD